MSDSQNTTNIDDKLTFYSEIGNYFNPDGSFKETEFKKRLSFLIRENSQSNKIEEVLSYYINKLLKYLIEKKMLPAASSLLKSFTSELSINGISGVHIEPDFLYKILKIQESPEQQSRGERISKDEKRDLIFSSALKVFENEGYRKATMDKIAEAAGIGKASVYRIFKNKEVLLDELLSKHLAEIVSNVNEIHSTDDDILIQIKKMITYWVTYISANPVIYHLIQTESNSRGVSNKVIYYDFLTSNLPMFKERIVSQNREQKLRTMDFYSVFYGLLGYIDGVYIKWYRNGRNYDLTEEIPGLIDVLFHGVMGKNEQKK